MIVQKDVYKSDLERYFSYWLDELFDNGIIVAYEYEPETYKLSYPVKAYIKSGKKKREKQLLDGCEYTPDFIIKSGHEAIRRLFYSESHDTYIIEIKPKHDRNNMLREFAIKQKWLYHRHLIYSNKVVPDEIFKKTFSPERIRLTPKTKRPSKYAKYKTIKQWLEKEKA